MTARAGFEDGALKSAGQALGRNLPHEHRREIKRTFKRLGQYGVRIGRSLAPTGTGRTRNAIKYEISRLHNGYELNVVVDAKTKDDALAVFVTEFGRGHGADGFNARGTLPPRPFLRPSRTLVRKRARSSLRTAMRRAAKQALARRAKA